MLSPDTKYPIEKITDQVVFLKNDITNPNIIVGDYTYYNYGDNGTSFEKENVLLIFACQLIIGKFCQIANGTRFIMSDANHQMDGFSTFPFFVFGIDSYTPNLPRKGDTYIGNDVWFGDHATILPGITIGDGCIIGANATVAKDIPPYSIVVGNPGKVIRRRFDDETIAKLLDIEWWNFDIKTITDNVQAIVGADIEKLMQIKESLR
ncbi:MAG: Virginiamycin A acetyltransferase [Chlamydiia bacterium]|nr:Virginiamycin A acetyltransferase [Chlamydiia bacterium]